MKGFCQGARQTRRTAEQAYLICDGRLSESQEICFSFGVGDDDRWPRRIERVGETLPPAPDHRQGEQTKGFTALMRPKKSRQMPFGDFRRERRIDQPLSINQLLSAYRCPPLGRKGRREQSLLKPQGHHRGG